jgi:hypothetical protein
VQVSKELRRCVHREIASLRRERAVESIAENREGGLTGKEEELCMHFMSSHYHPEQLQKDQYSKLVYISHREDTFFKLESVSQCHIGT